MIIKEVRIRYFRSIYSDEINLGNLNIFAGRNDVGKSNLLKALNLFFNNQTGWQENFDFEKDFNLSRSQEFKEGKNAHKAREISIEVFFEDVGEQSPVWVKTWRQGKETEYTSLKYDAKRGKNAGFKARSKVPNMLDNIHYFYVPALKTSEYISYLIGQLSNILSNQAQESVDTAKQSFEKELAQYLSDITDDIKTTLHIDSLLKLPSDLTSILEKMEFSNNKGVVLKSRGDGIRTRHIPILLNKISTLTSDLKIKRTTKSHFIWGYEEPESNIELSASFDMANEFLEDYSKNHQVVIATHSPAFYDIPEKNNPLWKQGIDGIYRYVVCQENDKSEYLQSSSEDLDNDLSRPNLPDPDFLLPVVSQKLREERQKNKELATEVKQLRSEIDKNNVPHIFLEGDSDRIIFRKAVSVFFPEHAGNITILSSRDRGGARFVKKSLLHWDMIQYSEKQNERIKAIGIFDHDEAGLKAKKEVSNIIATSDYTFCRTYQTEREGHLLDLVKSGINLPFELESFYSPKLMDAISENDWLEDRQKIHEILHDELIEDLANNSTIIDDLYDSKYELYVKKEIKEICKIRVAEFIANSSPEDVEEYLYLFKPLLASVLKEIGLEIVNDSGEENKETENDSE